MACLKEKLGSLLNFLKEFQRILLDSSLLEPRNSDISKKIRLKCKLKSLLTLCSLKNLKFWTYSRLWSTFVRFSLHENHTSSSTFPLKPGQCHPHFKSPKINSQKIVRFRMQNFPLRINWISNYQPIDLLRISWSFQQILEISEKYLIHLNNSTKLITQNSHKTRLA